MLDQAHRALHDGPRAPVVRLEVDPSQARQGARQAENPSHVREPPAVDRLVVVAHEEHVVVRRREQQGELQLGPIEVLRLVDEQPRAPPPPADQDALIGLEEPERADDEVVEVDATELRNRPLVNDERARDRARGRVARNVGAIAERVLEVLKVVVGPARVEGLPACDWVLIDAGDVIVHVFRPEVRSFYNLEKMWGADRPRERMAG